jgi:tetratricopeptide (TPR) repeat protein
MIKTLPVKLFCLLILSLSLTACTAYQVGGNIQKGRAALMTGDPKIALAHFQRGAELKPDYVLDFSNLPQSVWTYVGRAYYAQGNFSQAHKAFEQARARHEEDNLAKLYLGLVLARDGNRQKGLREIEAGLRGLGEWLNYLQRYHPEGQFWDPGGDLRNEIQKDLAVIDRKDINWERLILSVEWLGKKFEEEIDLVRRDKRQELMQDGDDDGGEEP